MSELSAREAIYTLRAMRRLRPDPVPEAELRFLVEAATQAPSAQNEQAWAFVVVTDPARRRQLGALYRELGQRYIRDGALARAGLAGPTARVHRHALRLAEQLHRAPALVLAALRGPVPRDPAGASAWYGSIFPAVQNLLLAARSRGLGTTLTTLHRGREREVKQLLGIPDPWETVALIPVGYPAGRFGRPLRRPAWEVTHWERWGALRQERPGGSDPAGTPGGG
jgi:nitroreductase